jgi:hypothetical protein
VTAIITDRTDTRVRVTMTGLRSRAVLLTPDEARRLAAELLVAADTLEADRCED